jgi:phosphatidylglycerophosphatase C
MNLALFDFDGTITTREMFPDFMYYAIAPGRLATGRILLSPLIIGYKLGVVSGTLVRASIVRFGFAGVSVDQFEVSGRNFADTILPTALRQEALDRIAWHKAQGDKIVVVSGAFDIYLSHWCNLHKLDLICSSLAYKDKKLTGHYHGEQCVGPEKVRRVQERYDLKDYPVIYAYGDTKEDLDLLSIAHKRYYQWQEVAHQAGVR